MDFDSSLDNFEKPDFYIQHHLILLAPCRSLFGGITAVRPLRGRSSAACLTLLRCARHFAPSSSPTLPLSVKPPRLVDERCRSPCRGGSHGKAAHHDKESALFVRCGLRPPPCCIQHHQSLLPPCRSLFGGITAVRPLRGRSSAACLTLLRCARHFAPSSSPTLPLSVKPPRLVENRCCAPLRGAQRFLCGVGIALRHG